MSTKKYAKTRAEADTERWYVTVLDKCGDVSDKLDEDIHEGTRRVSDWELVTAFDRFNGIIPDYKREDLPSLSSAFSRSYYALLYVWRCRIVDVGGAE